MEFAIQVSSPSSVGTIENAESIAEALESIFPLSTEFALLIWNNVYVPLNYKYDVSYIFEDVILLIEAVCASPTGRTSIHWPSSSFRAKWDVSWTENEVVVESEWECVIGGTELLLNKNPRISVTKETFLGEWTELIVACLRHIRSRDTSRSLDLTRYERIVRLVSKRGYLYQI